MFFFFFFFLNTLEVVLLSLPVVRRCLVVADIEEGGNVTGQDSSIMDINSFGAQFLPPTPGGPNETSDPVGMSGPALTLNALESHNKMTPKKKSGVGGKRYKSRSSRSYSSFGGDIQTKSLLTQRLPSPGLGLMMPLASITLYASLELSDQDGVKAMAVEMKRRQIEETYDSSLTNFGWKDFISIVSKTALIQMCIIIVNVTSFFVFPSVLSIQAPPSELTDSLYGDMWPWLMICLWILSDCVGRHIAWGRMCCGVIVGMTFVSALIAARCLLVYMYFSEAFDLVPQLSLWLKENMESYIPWVYGVGIMGFTHGYVVTVCVLVITCSYSNICMNITTYISILATVMIIFINFIFHNIFFLPGVRCPHQRSL